MGGGNRAIARGGRLWDIKFKNKRKRKIIQVFSFSTVLGFLCSPPLLSWVICYYIIPINFCPICLFLLIISLISCSLQFILTSSFILTQITINSMFVRFSLSNLISLILWHTDNLPFFILPLWFSILTASFLPHLL